MSRRMSKIDDSGGEAGASASQQPREKRKQEQLGPSLEADVLFLNEEVYDLLKILDYEKTFCDRELQPVPPCYFAYPAANPALQLRYFQALVHWLLKRLDKKPSWGKWDDPGTVATSMSVILDEMRLGVEVSPAKLKQGHGEVVCGLLVALLRKVLQEEGFRFHQPVFPDDGFAEEAEVDDDAELQAEIMEDEMAEGEEEDGIYGQEGAILGGTKRAQKAGGDGMGTGDGAGGEGEDEEGLMDAQVDPNEWALEVERATPKLKVHVPSDSKEWRAHQEQSRHFKKTLDDLFPQTKRTLNQIRSEVQQVLERIRTKEVWINAQFESKILEHQGTKSELSDLSKKHTDFSDMITSLQTELKVLSDRLEQVQQETEEKSSAVTDTAPLVKVKDAVKQLKAEIKLMELRTGVVSHSLLQARMRSKPPPGLRQTADAAFDAEEDNW
uniref:Intraflagellar transport protein 57 n=1 Tax=Chromera velia CCMP2878 TaxID=1169474 RepID=A0A0G4I6F1_9ALVE|eukprot:Cvel_11395.t1-p1 / transcript=Cvel_11395.t1 / gene=Cvel_11395 / organism=Chromera_velia_CCMP2878 / gene_product=Intraflagellar transport protein 57 homolog, putative / transcript_product=Intraflagellar transport protein 57 homolog, putative / location=Cvel_scaffold715:20113-24261(-) / protein_length=440 / sequence_SO=supercontig / SO=protein_coding / is_pseudo=false